MKLSGRKISTKAGKKLRKNEDFFVSLSAAGSRGSSKIIQQLIVHNELTFCTGDAGYCMRTAVANAIAIADGHGAAREMLELEDIPDRSLAAVGAWIESALKKYSLRKIQVPDWQETHEYLLARKSGIFLAKLEGVDQDGKSIRHKVLVDSAQRLVFDVCEKHARRLCNDSFDACVGDDFSFIGVGEVRLFNIQKVGKRPGRSRRMPKGIRKLRNKARLSRPSSKGVRKPTRQTRKRIVKEIED